MTSPLRKSHRITAPNIPRAATANKPRRAALSFTRKLTSYLLTATFVASVTAFSNNEICAADDLPPPPSFNAASDAEPIWTARQDNEPTSLNRAANGPRFTNAADGFVSRDGQPSLETHKASRPLKWRAKRPSSYSVSEETTSALSPVALTSDADASDGPKLISASGVWDEPRHEPRHDPQVRPAAQLKPVDPFDDPFGDRQLVQQPRGILHQPDPMPIQPPATDQLPEQPRPLVQPGRDFLPQPVPDDSAPERLPQPKDPQDCQEDKNCETGIYPVTGISLDITPPLETNIRDIDVDPAQRKQFYLDPNYMGDLRVRGGLSNESRVWYGRNGQRLADGRLVDFAHDKIVIEQANGRQTTVRFQQLSEDDLCYVTSWWRLPNECLLGDEQYAGRAFIPSTYTWTASALCHKPLYFEDIQLERYGHSTGPFVQPFKSAAHFFVNIAVSPYKIGINPPHECQYALGYYRPGDCAPWLIEPVPVSLRGAALQATAVVGGIYLIP